jgi:hypothetical protein
MTAIDKVKASKAIRKNYATAPAPKVADEHLQADVRRVFPRLGPWCEGCLQQGDGVCMVQTCVRYPLNKD